MQQPDARSISIAIQRHDQPGAFWKGSDQVTTDSGPRSRRMGFAAEPKWMRWSTNNRYEARPLWGRTAGASHSLQNSRKFSFYKSMGEFKLAAPRTDEVEGSSWARQAAIQCSPCRVVRAKSAPPATNVAHPPKTKEARANHCSPEPLQLVLRIGSATSHQKEAAKVRPNTTATAIPVDLSNAI